MTTSCRPTRRAVTQSLVLGAASIVSGVPSIVCGQPATAAKMPGADWDVVADAGFKPAGLEAAIRRTVESREFADGCARVGARPAFMDAEGFGKLIATGDAELAKLMDVIGLKKP